LSRNGNGPQEVAAPPRGQGKNAAITPQLCATSVTRDDDTQPEAARKARKQAPTVSASLYFPVNGRGWWWLSIRCPWCRGVHLGRVRDERLAAGPRRTTCGPVLVIVRRVYRSQNRTEAAA
jgi:hypothetical protein